MEEGCKKGVSGCLEKNPYPTLPRSIPTPLIKIPWSYLLVLEKGTRTPLVERGSKDKNRAYLRIPLGLAVFTTHKVERSTILALFF